MVNIKKSLLVLLFFIIGFGCLNAQSNNSLNNEESQITQGFDENSIILSDNFQSSTEKQNNEIKTPSTIGLLIRMIVVLVIVVALIYGVLWFIKKKTNIVKNEDEFLRRAAYLNIAPGKTVEVITLIDKAYLIGVTEDNITMLGEIEDKELINAMNVNADKKQNIKKPLNFSEVLDIFTAKSKKTNIFSETEQQVENIYKTNEDENENV